MRHLIKGLIAAVAVMAAAPAMAAVTALAQRRSMPRRSRLCGLQSCGGWVRERLPDPEQQYYYVNQGPTYTGPGNWAPRRVYREGSISGYGYGYNRRIARTAIITGTTRRAITTASACCAATTDPR
jgi:hypothetical protein